MRKQRRGASRSRRVLLVGASVAVVALGAIVTPQAFAGTSGGSGLTNAGPGRQSFFERLRARAAGQNGGGQNGGGQDAGGGQNAAGCSDVELVFARGTGEPQGLGIV